MTDLTEAQIKLAFQVSPIFLTGRPVANILGGLVPLIYYTDAALYAQAIAQLVAETSAVDLNDAFGAFTVVPGGTLIDQQVATYPYANQQIAGNATIFDPLKVSLIWDTPLRGQNPRNSTNSNAWGIKFATLSTLQVQLYNHNNNGGTFTVVTPSFIYQNMLLTSLTDASRATQPVPQNAWRWDFTKPMIAMSDIQAAASALIQKLDGGLVTNGAWSGALAGAGLPSRLPSFLTGSPISLPTGNSPGVGGSSYSP